jgi:hypothetical protein
VLDLQQLMENRRLLPSHYTPPLTAPNEDLRSFEKKRSLELRGEELEQALYTDLQELLVACAERLEFQDLVWGGMDPQAAEIRESLVTDLELSMEELDFILTGIDTNMAHQVPSSDLRNACFTEHHDGAGKIANERAFVPCNDQETHSLSTSSTVCAPMTSIPIIVLKGENVASVLDLQLTRPFTEMEYHF